MIGFIVQARLGSTRLPNKILLPFYQGKSIFELLLEKLLHFQETKCVVATTLDPINDQIVEICDKYGVTCFRGDENDVMQRFISAAQLNDIDKIIRVCSDNPFLNIAAISELIAKVKSTNKDYISFDILGIPSIKTHFGFWTEYVALEALYKVRTLTSDMLYYEHVTNYIYTHPELFEIDWITPPPIIVENKNIRLTIDTLQDFQVAQQIYHAIDNKDSFVELFNYIKDHPDIMLTMQKQIELNSK